MLKIPRKNKRRRKSPLIYLKFRDSMPLKPIIGIADELDWELWESWPEEIGFPVHLGLAGALIDVFPDQPDFVKKLLENNCPTVQIELLSRPLPDDNVVPTISRDQASAGILAAEHFKERAFKNVAFLGFHPESPNATAHPLFLNFKKRASELDMAFHLMSQVKTHKNDEPKDERRLRRRSELVNWLKSIPKPIGLLTFNSWKARVTSFDCMEEGISIPEEVAILGYGNAESYQLKPMPISCIDDNKEKIVETACRLLHGLMNGEPIPKKTIMIPAAGIIERKSTNVMAVSDIVVAKALRFIWDHYKDKNLTIDEIVEYSGVCRRTLEMKFRKCIDKGISATLRKKRLEECRKHLSKSNLTAEQLAHEVGFSSGNYLHKAFSKAFGMTLSEYYQKQL